jgi:hypothetical protein
MFHVRVIGIAPAGNEAGNFKIQALALLTADLDALGKRQVEQRTWESKRTTRLRRSKYSL